jgi:hypothetical protein
MVHNEVGLWSLDKSPGMYLRAEVFLNQRLRAGYIFKRRLGDGLQVVLLSDAWFVALTDMLV